VGGGGGGGRCIGVIFVCIVIKCSKVADCPSGMVKVLSDAHNIHCQLRILVGYNSKYTDIDLLPWFLATPPTFFAALPAEVKRLFKPLRAFLPGPWAALDVAACVRNVLIGDVVRVSRKSPNSRSRP